ncbi:MAG TPA: ATP synthase F1 subunit epsilon [bacterium]|jgi:F-type H+-transporting ATPase subunit epsilon|nr:ATP synthase F1 subunit epsilon [bacterium]
MKTFQLEIVTPDGVAYQGGVESLVLPAWEGLLGVLHGHEPMVAVMKTGPLHYEKDGKTEWLAVSGGFAQIGPEKVVLLVETAEAAEAIDAARAKAQAELKEQALKSKPSGDPDYAKLEAGLLLELVRIKVAGRSGR